LSILDKAQRCAELGSTVRRRPRDDASTATVRAGVHRLPATIGPLARDAAFVIASTLHVASSSCSPTMLLITASRSIALSASSTRAGSAPDGVGHEVRVTLDHYAKVRVANRAAN
jgi:hypothetical protein